MHEGYVRKLFERRQFTQDERDNMRELYSNAELLAIRISRTIPECHEQALAVGKLKEALAYCETAVALHPRQSVGDTCSASVANSFKDAESLKRQS